MRNYLKSWDILSKPQEMQKCENQTCIYISSFPSLLMLHLYFILYCVYCIVYTMYIVYYTGYTILCILYSVYYTVYNIMLTVECLPCYQLENMSVMVWCTNKLLCRRGNITHSNTHHCNKNYTFLEMNWGDPILSTFM